MARRMGSGSDDVAAQPHVPQFVISSLWTGNPLSPSAVPALPSMVARTGSHLHFIRHPEEGSDEGALFVSPQHGNVSAMPDSHSPPRVTSFKSGPWALRIHGTHNNTRRSFLRFSFPSPASEATRSLSPPLTSSNHDRTRRRLLGLAVPSSDIQAGRADHSARGEFPASLRSAVTICSQLHMTETCLAVITRMLRSSAMILLLAALFAPPPATAHDIPIDITVQMFVKPSRPHAPRPRPSPAASHARYGIPRSRPGLSRPHKGRPRAARRRHYLALEFHRGLRGQLPAPATATSRRPSLARIRQVFRFLRRRTRASHRPQSCPATRS